NGAVVVLVVDVGQEVGDGQRRVLVVKLDLEAAGALVGDIEIDFDDGSGVGCSDESSRECKPRQHGRNSTRDEFHLLLQKKMDGDGSLTTPQTRRVCCCRVENSKLDNST